MTALEKEKRIQSMIDGTENSLDSTAILFVDDVILRKERRCYDVRLREEGNPIFYNVTLPHKVFKGFFDSKVKTDNPRNLAVVVKSLKSAEFGIILDADGWKTLREKCIQRADSSDSKKVRTHIH